MVKKDTQSQEDNPFVSYPGLLNDILFKIVFGSHQNKAILRALLNALLNLQGPEKIVDLEILSPSAEKMFLDDKGPVLDLKAEDGSGSRYNVEVQLRKGAVDYIKRSLYYTTKLYNEQLKSGHDYDRLQKAVSISILDFNLFPDSTELHSKFLLWDREWDVKLTDDLELHYIELLKFTPNKPHQLKTRLEKWLYLLKFADLYHNRDLPENLVEEEGIQMAIDSMRKAYARDEVRELIEAREKAERDEMSRMAHAERKGREKGREEVARRMLAEGFSLEQIQRITEVSPEQLGKWSEET
jgi:predicted transposase/invertase (TIGR01784 family)